MYSRGVTDRPAFDFHGTLANSGPLSRDQALASLDHAAELMAASQFEDAARLYQRVIGFDDRGVTAAAMLGFGQAMHRLDEEDQAIGAWQEVVSLPVTPATYPAWRELAGARVRTGDLAAAAVAYQQADRLAPPADKAEIASRLGWLSKEMGDPKAAGRYFSTARGGSAIAMTIALIAVTTVISLAADFGGKDGAALWNAFSLDKPLVAAGQFYRLVTSALIHFVLASNPYDLPASPLHLPLNMYALWIVGPVIERLYGRWRMLAFYVLAAVGGSLMSFAFGPSSVSVGASGAVFGMFGLLAGSIAVHRPALGPNTRGVLVNVVTLIALNLFIGFSSTGIDNWGHIGGLLVGLWFGALFMPSGVPVIRSMWQRPGPEAGSAVPILGRVGMVAVQLAGVAGLVVAFGVLWSIGYPIWSAVAQ